MKRRAACRPVDGVLLLDKPRGPTSNRALQLVKHLLEACKAGHTGSLDPLATGLLPLCFGEATKLSQFLLEAEKRYWAVFRLGVTTTTFDSEGEVRQVRPVAVDRQMLERALVEFRGEIDQVPPMYSALKHEGRPLYELAREGLEVDREVRRVTIDEIVVHSLEGDRLELEIACSKGTYIRSLAYDLGERLGCGAHVAELRRLSVGTLRVDQAVTLESLEALADPAARAARLIPADQVLSAIPDIHLTALAAHYLQRGQAVTARHDYASGWVRLYDPENRFLGMGQVLDDGRVAPRRLLAQKL
ncbi:MAG: tRNA pseudouridine(55) synthase TruB [Gammaproteobacteria bacterium]|nr:tRNA pseudouridine(55) synthase TruB [Gammaproteobacteria bacterium]